ncbi:4-hydroxyphenylpyruvate dioxygenase-like protein [Sphaerodactylus townsendi]|uniref:4-hydroxyphenylpyruvate dioxygenase-like protein n=1 Tax=Sphaerodactylus townsendi TaxID=933632 RepID=UPI0020273B1C|nr:4-hydroxyphenylpyruvate dioxygenase-like protein [Sphaerodactylus townsendi]
MSVKQLCYIGFHVPEKQQLAKNLVQKFGFELFAARVTASSKQLALRRGAAVFIVNERLKAAREVPPKFSSDPCKDQRFLYDVDLKHAVSTASNICFEMENVPGVSQSLQEQGCQILIPPTNVADEGGCVTYAVVRSILGNISHTLLDRSQYCGLFLPGFLGVEGSSKDFRRDREVTHFDHITYACTPGSSQAILDWYKKCFGFQRFFVHQQDAAAEGYSIRGAGMGLRLTAMHCSGSGLTQLDHDCKLVLAESLPQQRKNQVDTFLEQHGGAGIQHVALYTSDIIRTAAAMAKSGASFVEPPITYYSDNNRAKEMQQVGQDPQLLEHYGILLDSEVAEESSSISPGVHGKQYLMQIFTKPLFAEDTFFLELIERSGAIGFGERNIRALWQAVQNYMDKQ